MKHIIVLLIFLLSFGVFAQDVDYIFNPVVVTATRYPVLFSGVNRKVTVLDSMQLAAIPGHAIQDVLSNIAGVDMQRRGPMGIQAEAGIRGGSFEETLILVDGIAINDPQTAHHNFDIPVTMQDVERIEVLHGQGVGIHGADALAGVINIITRADPGHSVQLFSGEYGLRGGAMVLAGNTANILNRLSAQTSRSNGYTDYTDFEQFNVLNRTKYSWGDNEFNLQTGYNEKRFGANSFYSLAFPNEREETRTLLVSGLGVIRTRNLTFSPKVSWKKHKDDFILDNSRPDWYRNKHTSLKSNVQFPVLVTSDFGLLEFGGRYTVEQINSSNLGDHNREHGGVFFSWSSPVWNRFQCNTSLYSHHYQNWGWHSWPSMDISYRLSDWGKVYASGGDAFRVPSFTELYYTSPANIGNPDLQYSKARTVEIGLSANSRHVRSSIAVFERNGKNVIDWMKLQEKDPWQVLNITRLNTRGFEADIAMVSLYQIIETMNLGFSYIQSDKDAENYQFKYALNYLRYHAQWGMSIKLPYSLYTGWQVQWKKRETRHSYVLIDANLRYKYDDWQINLNALNLFDADYMEISGVPMPGRWITVGLEYTL